MYDHLIRVQAFGKSKVFAHEVNKRGKCCLVVEKRDHTGGEISHYE